MTPDDTAAASRHIAAKVAHRLHRRFPRVPFEDLEQACWLGVLEGCREFDPARGALLPLLYRAARNEGMTLARYEYRWGIVGSTPGNRPAPAG